jgi:acetyl esterase/lipase
VTLDEYPPQEPFTAIGARYHDEVLRRGASVTGVESRYGADPYCSLTIVPAAEPNGDVLVVFHGGGWTNGYKEWMLFMAPALTAPGVTFVTAGYRLAPQHVYPTQLHDAYDAIAAVHRVIPEYGGDADRIFVGGHSAGGHLAALAGLRTGWTASRNLPDRVIRGALPISGTYLFGPQSGLAMRPRFLGPEGNGQEQDASPLTHVGPHMPPFLVSYGSNDFPHLRQQAQDFIAAMRAQGNDVTECELPDCDHLGASYASGEPASDWSGKAAAWMREH